jgi:hypothetical protein
MQQQTRLAELSGMSEFFLMERSRLRALRLTMPKLEHVGVRLPVSVDAAKWMAPYRTPPDEIADAVRRCVSGAVRDNEAARVRGIAAVRRAQL